MLFVFMIVNRRIHLLLLMFSLSILALAFSRKEKVESRPSEVKIALRNVGHNTLIHNNDTLSLVLPVKHLNNSKYKLSFERPIVIYPDSLVATVKESFKHLTYATDYIVEVIECDKNEVAYSFKIINNDDTDIISCLSRVLPRDCYSIEIDFINKDTKFLDSITILFFISLLILFATLFFYLKSKSSKSHIYNNSESIEFGNYIFHASQNTLTFKSDDFLLSKKEGEILYVLVTNLNQVVRREDLSKQVWEANGVVVGRSLDTYISKLRKRFKHDNTIKLTNIHGVGYKLEVVKPAY